MMKTGDATGFDLEPKDDVWAPFPNPLPELERFQYWPAHVPPSPTLTTPTNFDYFCRLIFGIIRNGMLCLAACPNMQEFRFIILTRTFVYLFFFNSFRFLFPSNRSYFDARELIPFASGLQRYQTVLDALALKPTPDQVAPYQKFLQAVDDVCMVSLLLGFYLLIRLWQGVDTIFKASYYNAVTTTTTKTSTANEQKKRAGRRGTGTPKTINTVAKTKRRRRRR